MTTDEMIGVLRKQQLNMLTRIDDLEKRCNVLENRIDAYEKGVSKETIFEKSRKQFPAVKEDKPVHSKE